MLEDTSLLHLSFLRHRQGARLPLRMSNDYFITHLKMAVVISVVTHVCPQGIRYFPRGLGRPWAACNRILYHVRASRTLPFGTTFAPA